MFLTVDMSAPARIAEIHFDSLAAFGGGGGGPRPAAARGAAPTAPGTAGPQGAAAAAARPAAPAGPPLGQSAHPRAYEVHVSLDGKQWGLPVAKGQGTPGSTTIVLDRPVRARYLRITQTGTEDAPAWSVARLQVYGPPSPASARPSAE
jgi:hypothetical protein